MKKILFTFVFFIIILYSILFTEQIIFASKNGILLWFEQILPALLPFTILSSLLLGSHFLHSFSGNANLLAILTTMTCGFVFGFPIGAKLSSDFYKEKLLTEKQANILAIFTNNYSPMYVCGFTLPLLFDSAKHTLATYILIYFIPLLFLSVLLIYNLKTNNILLDKDINKINTPSFQLNTQVIDTSITNGFQSLIKICGYIVFFSIISQILTSIWSNPPLVWDWILENFEITNGIQLLSESNLSDSVKYTFMIQLLSFGGLSGIAQSASVLSESGLSIYKYIIGKVALSLLLTLLSVIYVFLFV